MEKNCGTCVYQTDIRRNLPLSPVEVDFFNNGDALDRTPKLDKNLRLSLVISHCDEDMSWMKDFLTFDIKDVTIYSKCGSPINNAPPGSKIIKMPNYGRCDHSYANWMLHMEEKDATDNHIVLFLKASRESEGNGSHTGFLYRSMQDMVRIAVANGFSCGYQRSDFYFHDTVKIRDFAMNDYKKENIKSSYANMGEYLDAMGAELPSPILPVCYGGNFAAKATQIWTKRNILKKIEQSLTRGDSIEEGHFVERMWAGLLSRPLDSDEIDVLNRIPTRTSNIKPAVFGRLNMLYK